MVGNIIDIKKFTLHDGPGIRSTVFLKGCPLRCIWCHNPEGIDFENHLWYFEKKCIHCHLCLAACPNQALSIQEKPLPHIRINKLKCSCSGGCAKACPTGALCFDGQSLRSEDVVRILLEDRSFYEESGGGITLSGGDPLYQYEFSLEILKACKDAGLHTAIETSMHSKKEFLARFLDFVDLFIVDLKLFDTVRHAQYTGVGNKLILSNFEFLVSQNKPILVRIPLIPGITDTQVNIRSIASYVYQISRDTPIELINYNPLAENKYRLMNRDTTVLKGMKPLNESELDSLYEIIASEKVPVVRQTSV